MPRFYHIKRKQTREVASATEESRIEEKDPVIAFRDEAVLEESLSTAAWRAAGWLLRSFVLLFLVIVFVLGGIIAQRSASLVKAELEERAAATQMALQDGLDNISQGNLGDALVNFKLAKANLAYSAQLFYGLGQGGVLVANLPYYQFGVPAKQKFLTASLEIVSGGVEALSAAEEGQKVLARDGLLSLQDTEKDQLLSALKRLQEKLTRARILVERGKRRLDSLERTPDAEVQAYLTELRPKTELAFSALSLSERLMTGLPDVLGFNKLRSYLLMFQNNNEIRPTGGFFGSYGILELKNGAIQGLKVDDVYRIDGQLVGPNSTEKVIPNANFDPDFLVSSQKIRTLYEKAGGGSVDGVIAFTPRLLEDLLRLTGSIYLPERKLNLTAANIVDLLQHEIEVVDHAEAQPKAILSEIAPILLSRLTSADQALRTQLGQLMLVYLKEKELLLALDNQKVASVLSELHFDGSLKMVPAGGDYLLINRANIGARKSSQHLYSQFYYLTTIAENGEISGSLTLTFRHQGSNLFPDGPNQDFIRLYIPSGSHLIGVIGSDSDQEAKVEASGNYAVVSFYLTTQPGETREVIVNYQLPFKFDFRRDQNTYQLYLEKQPGLKNALLTVKLQVPKDWISYADDPFSREGGTLTLYNGPFKEDLGRRIILER